jgi:hypothetical protein
VPRVVRDGPCWMGISLVESSYFAEQIGPRPRGWTEWLWRILAACNEKTQVAAIWCVVCVRM